MKFVQIISGCDMTKAATGEIVVAQETLYLALGTDPANLTVRELDLTKDWADQLREATGPYLAASHELGEISVPGGIRRDARDASGESAIVYNRAMRAWADATGFEAGGKPGYYKQDKGGYYHHRALKEAYAEHLIEIAAGGSQEQGAAA